MTVKEASLIGHYAKALAELALEKGQAAQVEADLRSLLTVVTETGLAQHLSSPALSPEDKASLMTSLQVSEVPYLNHWLAVLAQNGRAAYLEKVLRESLEELSRLTNHYDVTLVTAQAFSEEQKGRLKELVKARFGLDCRHLTEEVDPSLLGGFVVKVNNQLIDTSIRRQLQALKMKLK